MYWRIIVECSVVHHICSYAEGHSLGICPEIGIIIALQIMNIIIDHTSQGQGWRAVQYDGRLNKIIFMMFIIWTLMMIIFYICYIDSD